MDSRDYPAIAQGYARDVVSSKIPAGKSIRLQCKRFLEELKLQRDKGFPYRFDQDKAARVCRFIERLPHSKGKWARQRSTIRLEPWQVWILACTFGWLHKASGLRRFRVLFVVVPRKNGKSALSAGIGLYMLCADGEHGAEIYSGATTQKQAEEVFVPAQIMARRTPALLRKFGVEVLARTIVRIDDNSKFETIIGNPGDGQSPSCSIHDEYHEHVDDRQIDTMLTGMGAREQPLQVLITTAGDNLAGPCYARIHEERKKLALESISAEQLLQEETFFVEYTIDEDDDWKSEAALRKANPNFDVSVNGDYLRGQIRTAITTPRKAGVIKTKHLNLWVSSKSAYFDVEAWRRCRDPELPTRAEEALALERLAGRRVVLGLDLASKVDIAALEYLFLPLGDKATVDDPFIRIGRYFLPADTVADVAAYQGWHAQGLLDVTAGNITDYEEIEQAIEEACKRFQVEQVPYDPFQATYLVTRLTKLAVPVIEFRQTVLNFSEPMKELDALIRSRRIVHGGCPVMEWQISNVVGAPDKKDNVYTRAGGDLSALDNEQRQLLRRGHQELRTQVAGTNASGGFTVPKDLASEIVKTMKDWGPMYDSDIVRVISTSSGNELDIPTNDDTGNSAAALAEGADPTDDNSGDLVFGQGRLDAYVDATPWIKLSFELVQDSAFDLQGYLGEALGERLGRRANNRLTVGTGTSQPNGIMTASAAGKIAASASAIAPDEVLEFQHSVNAAYRRSPKCRWMFADSTLLVLRKLKDGQGNYLWQMGDVRVDAPDTLLAKPYSINDDIAPIATGARVMAFGDFSRYWVRKVGNPMLFIAKERFYPKIGHIGLIRYDGELVDSAAVKHFRMS